MPRTLTEPEYTAIRDKVLERLPPNLSEAEYQRVVGPAMEQALGIAENSEGPLVGSSLERALGGLWKNLNPVTMVQGLYGAVRHPIDTAGTILSQQGEMFQKAAAAPSLSESVGYGAAGLLPVVGPMAAKAGERIASGDIAGGIGEGAGLAAPFAAGAALKMRAASRATSAAPAILEQQAIDQVAGRVLAPGNVRYKGRAQSIAPEILKRGLKGGREDLRLQAESGLADAGQRIDAAYQSVGGAAAPVAVDPIVKELAGAIDDLSINGQPIKGAEARVAALKDRITQLESTAQKPAATPQNPTPGATLPFEELRKFRDEQYRLATEARGYERMGNPIYSNEGFAAREAGSAVRQEFARHSPEAAQANADYTFFKTLGDVLDPAVGRPKATAPTEGVTGGGRTSGAVAGMLIGPKTAFAMSVVVPWIRRMKSEPAWLLADAQDKMRLAAAIRDGNVPRSQSLMAKIGQGSPRATSPSESQSQTTAPVVP